MRSRVWFTALPWGIFPEGEDSHGDHGLGRLVEFRFKSPPGTTSSYITTHIIRTAPLGRPNLRSQLHSCHAQEGGPRSPQGHVVGIGHWIKKKSWDWICSFFYLILQLIFVSYCCWLVLVFKLHIFGQLPPTGLPVCLAVQAAVSEGERLALFLILLWN